MDVPAQHQARAVCLGLVDIQLVHASSLSQARLVADKIPLGRALRSDFLTGFGRVSTRSHTPEWGAYADRRLAVNEARREATRECAVLKSSLAIIFSAGLLLTAGVGGALARQVDSQAAARAPLGDDTGCGQKDEGGENHDTKCDENATGTVNWDAMGSGDSIDQPDDESTNAVTDEQDGGQGQTGENEGDHQD